MSDKKVEYFYFKIKYVCKEMERIGLSQKIICAAKKEQKDEVIQIFEQFKLDNKELWNKISKLYIDYQYERRPVIFRSEKNPIEDKGLFRYNPSKINPLNLIILFAMSNGKLYEKHVWREDSEVLSQVFADKGYSSIANYMKTKYVYEICDLIYIFQE